MIHGLGNRVSVAPRAGHAGVADRTERRNPESPPTDFNGVLALVIDINRFVEVYLDRR